MLADEQREVLIMENGNIAVAVGMKNVSFESSLCLHMVNTSQVSPIYNVCPKIDE